MTADFAASYGTLCGHSTSFYVATPLSLLLFLFCLGLLGIVLAFGFGAQPVQVKPKKTKFAIKRCCKTLKSQKDEKTFYLVPH